MQIFQKNLSKFVGFLNVESTFHFCSSLDLLSANTLQPIPLNLLQTMFMYLGLMTTNECKVESFVTTSSKRVGGLSENIKGF